MHTLKANVIAKIKKDPYLGQSNLHRHLIVLKTVFKRFVGKA